MGLIDEWNCQICGEKRPDDRISVLSKPLVIEGRVIGTQNIKYCNDRPSCIEKAKDYSYFKDKKED